MGILFHGDDDDYPPLTPEEQAIVSKNNQEHEEMIEAALKEAEALDKANVTAAKVPGSKSILSFQKSSPFGSPDDPPFKPGVPSEYLRGVLYQGPWTLIGDGFNEHTRRCARALHATGCPVQLRGFGLNAALNALHSVPGDVEPLLETSISRYSVMIHQTILDPVAVQNLTTHAHYSPEEMKLINRFRVISTVFERDRVSPDTVRALDRCGQVWVACHANKDTLIRCGLPAEKIRVIPIPFFPDDPLLKLRGRDRIPGPPRFYHIGKWEPRKNQDRILLAFMRAFQPGEAVFVMKTSPGAPKGMVGYPASVDAAVHENLKDSVVQKNGWTPGNVGKSIFQKAQQITPEQVHQLHRMGDVYVTLSSGEGFDMPAYDAKLAGNRLVYTPSGGPQDFAGDGDLMISASGDRSCNPFYGWEPDARYLDFQVDDAVVAMRKAAQEGSQWREDLYANVGIRIDNKVVTPLLQRFSAETVGSYMLECLQELGGQVF